MIKFICTLIWETAELLDIPLGKLAPYIFGGTIGRWPKKIKNQGEENE